MCPPNPCVFLISLISDPVKGAVIDGGGILVNVPQPARFALHKLIVSRERPVTAHTKAAKDLAQAAQLFAVLIGERPGDLLLAWDELKQQGMGWIKRVEKALARTTAGYESIFQNTAAFLKL